MQIKVFTLKFSRAHEGFDDESVRAFVSDKEVISINEHFFIRDNIPYLVLTIRYNVYLGPDIPRNKYVSGGKKEEYQSLLNEETEPIFETRPVYFPGPAG